MDSAGLVQKNEQPSAPKPPAEQGGGKYLTGQIAKSNRRREPVLVLAYKFSLHSQAGIRGFSHSPDPTARNLHGNVNREQDCGYFFPSR